jgi:predicted metalloprotease with PDZ domain
MNTLIHGGTRACAGVVLFLLVSAGAAAANIHVQLDARDVSSKRVHTQLTIPVRPGSLTLVYPKWLPGEHGPTGPIESMIGLHIRANGADLAWTRDPVDMYALRVTVPAGATQLEIALESGLATAGSGFSAAPTSSDQLAILPWNEFLLFPKGIDAEKVMIDSSVTTPAGWKLVSALSSKGSGDSYSFETASIARLIDSPVQIGKHAKLFELAGSGPRADLAHGLSIMADSAGALEAPADFAAGYSRLVAENGALFGSRMYRHYTWLLSLSDHVAHFGLEHHESSDNRLEEAALEDDDSRMRVAMLLGHEYVHSWNAKYRRPAGLLSPDYQKPMDGTLLWIYEGMTQFWGDVLPTRAGLVTKKFYLEMLAHDAAHFDNLPGVNWRPLVDTATAAQILYPAPAAWESGRRSTDFYEASVFLWYDVDAEIRSISAGRANLDDFVRRFYAGANDAPQLKPYVEADIYAALNAVAQNDWRAFIHRHLDARDNRALLGMLDRSGYRLEYSAVKNDYIELRQKKRENTNRDFSIGLILSKDGEVIDTNEGRAAAKAGVSPGMTLIAVNGKKYTADVLDAAVLAAQKSRQPIELLVENADFYKTFKVEYFDGPRYPHLVRVDGKPDLLSQVLAPRVAAAAKP